MATQTKSEFHIGQKVNVKAYTDCFQKRHEAMIGMTIVEMEHINTESIAPYYRIKAIGENGKGYFQAADRFFESTEPNPSEPVIRLACNCCGSGTLGRQWHNRDTGYGMCSECIAWVRSRNTPESEIFDLYGVEGVHFSVPETQ